MDRLAELLALLATLAELPRDEQAQLAADLRAALAELADQEPTDENVELVEQTVQAIRQVDESVAAIDQAASDREARRAELLAQITPADEEGPAVEEESPAEETPEPAATDETAPAAVAAAARPRTAVRPPARTRPAATPEPTPARRAIVAAAQDSGVADGTQLDRQQALELVIATHNRYPGKSAEERRIPVVTTRVDYPPERTLGGDVQTNMRRIREVIGSELVMEAARAGQPILASGGLCAPLAPQYGLADISTDARPVRDSLAQFGATRGGIITRTPVSISEFSGAVRQWTNTNDTDAVTDSSVRKACLRVECPDDEEHRIYAVPACLEFGNLAARSDPENVADATNKTAAWHARFAERLLLSAMIAASQHPTIPETVTLGAIPEFLAAVDRAAVAIRNRQRATEDFTLEVWAPAMLLGILRSDALRTLPGDQLYQVNRAWIEARLRERNIMIHWTLEMPTSETGQDFTFQGSGGTLNGWPDAVTWIISHPGAHLFLDQGSLDFGIVRDSTLNARNDYQLFYESFEGHAYVGLESIAVTQDLCPSGARAATEDTSALCTSGS